MKTIKTPDQRVRVFISSTIGELADERKAATEAIVKLRLIPVLFELGARPHPPRDLYRAYLEQSHIFVGIYWNSYGWIAPDMQISGLEDEYQLSEGKTKLIYIKQPAEKRDERLTGLIKQMEHGGASSYRAFSTAAELKELLENDLAVVLSERFEHDHSAEEKQPAEPKFSSIPVIHSKLLGREKDLKELKELFSQPDVTLITLTGTGGTGKTRMAIELAQNLKEQFPDGIYYVPLASVTDAKLVAPTIAHLMGLFDSGKQDISDTLFGWLCDKKMLLVLDNFEQVVDAAVLLSRILEHCANVRILVTSRTPLHIRGEHIVPLMPLQYPQGETFFSRDEILSFPAVELFIQRAKAVNPHVNFDEANLRAIAEICDRLDGLPLAIELAASRTKFFSPVALQKRMKNTLDMLSHGARDLPERQKTLRATINWSYNLLEDEQKKLFRMLSVFRDGWTLDAAEAVATNAECVNCNVFEAMERLLDFGLVRTFSFYNEDDASIEPRFTMLQTVLEYSAEMLLEHNEAELVKKAHAAYFIAMTEEIDPDLWLVSSNPVFDRIDRNYQNLRAAFWNCIEAKQYRDAWRLVRGLNHCWMWHGRVGEAKQWIDASGVTNYCDKMQTLETTEDKKIMAGALLSAGIIMFSVGNFEEAHRNLTRCIDLYKELNYPAALGRAYIYLGINRLSAGDPAAVAILQQAYQHTKSINDIFGIVCSAATLAQACNIGGKFEVAKPLLQEGEKLAREFGSGILLGVALMQKGNMLGALGDFSNAAEAYKESLDAFKRSGYKIFSNWSVVGLAHCYNRQEDYENAYKLYLTAINEGKKTGERVIIALGLLGAACISICSGKLKKAVHLLGKTDAITKEIGFSFWLEDKNLYDRVTRMLQESLPAAEFKTEHDHGMRITLEEAVALAENRKEAAGAVV